MPALTNAAGSIPFRKPESVENRRADEWRKAIRGKLESIEDVYSIVAENFAVSTQHRVEWIQIIAFFYFTRK